MTGPTLPRGLSLNGSIWSIIFMTVVAVMHQVPELHCVE